VLPSQPPVLHTPTPTEVERVEKGIAAQTAIGGGTVAVGSALTTIGVMLPLPPINVALAAAGAVVSIVGSAIGAGAANTDPTKVLIRNQLEEQGFSKRYRRVYAKYSDDTPAELAQSIEKMRTKNGGGAREKEAAATAILQGDITREGALLVEKARETRITAGQRNQRRVSMLGLYLLIALVSISLALLAMTVPRAYAKLR
jgi:hypothetical protein